MYFNVDRLVLNITEYLNLDREALYKLVLDHNPFNKSGNYDFDYGLENMSKEGLCTYDGAELKGRIESFETVLEFINRIKSGET